MPKCLHKPSYFEYRFGHKSFYSEDGAWIIKINCTDECYFLCDRVYPQSKKLKADILVAFDREKNVCWKMVYNFLGIDEKTEKSTYILSEYPYSVFEHPCNLS